MIRAAHSARLFLSAALLAAPAAAGAEAGPGPAPAMDAGGRFMIPELPPNSPPITINGTDADWPAGSLSFTFNPVVMGGMTGSGKAFIRHPSNLTGTEELFLYFEVNDADSDIAVNIDNVVMMLDLSHDHGGPGMGTYLTSDDRGLRFNRNGTVDRIFGALGAPQDHEIGAVVNVQVDTSDPTKWRVEARILPANLGQNSFNALMGGALVATDASGGEQTRWPSTALPNPNTWANLVTRAPIDYALLIDQSGSMFGPKWASARQAANNFALLAGQLQDAGLNAEFGALGLQPDRLGLANFTWGAADLSSIVKPLASIAASPGDYVAPLPVNPSGMTPIGAGLNKTFQMFGIVGTPDLSRNRLVMLMTDGMHNKPNDVLDVTPPSTDLTYLPATPGDARVRVNPVAVGTDADVDTDLLVELRDRYSGSAFGGGTQGTMLNLYNIADPSEGQLTAKLTRYFVETIMPYYRVNTLAESNGPPIPSLSIAPGDRKLLLFAFWDNRANAVPLQVTNPSAAVVAGTANTSLGYSFLTIDNPAAGNWTNFQATGANYLLALVDLQVDARFGIDDRRHGTGSPILLRAQIQEHGAPVLDADVFAHEVFPLEGVGTLATLFPAGSCERQEPRLGEPVRLDERTFYARRIPLSIVAPQIPFKVDSAADPASYRGLWAQQYMERCGLKGLPRDRATGMRLVDDGTSGDETAKDGIYSLEIANTKAEGSYVFRFEARGKTDQGTPFEREHEVAEYVFVDVEPDPAISQSGVRVYGQMGTALMLEYWVMPADRMGGFLGPSMGHHVGFAKAGGGGEVVSQTIDNLNGIYSVLVRWDRRLDERPPTIIPTVQGERFPPMTYGSTLLKTAPTLRTPGTTTRTAPTTTTTTTRPVIRQRPAPTPTPAPAPRPRGR